MRRLALPPLLAASLLGTLLVPATALAHPTIADGPSTGPVPAAAAPAAMLATSTAPASQPARKPAAEPAASDKAADAAQHRPVRHIRLACARIVAEPAIAPTIGCRWSPIKADDLRGYRLWRVVDGTGPRTLVKTVGAGDPLRVLDKDVQRGHRYTYLVVALATDGTRIGASHRVTVSIPPRPDRLRIACGLVVGDARGVACKWTEARHPKAAGYVLYRSIDGAAREAIYRTGLDGRRSFLDRDVERGQTIRYAVVVVNKDGKPVGGGGPVVIRIPPREPRAADGA